MDAWGELPNSACKWSVQKNMETVACYGKKLLRRSILKPTKPLDLYGSRSKTLEHSDYHDYNVYMGF